MTGGILGSSFYDPGVKVPHHGQTGYARLPDGANQMLINDTIYLDDPAFILPRRSHVRRRKFQDLQNKCVARCHKPRSVTPGCADTITDTTAKFCTDVQTLDVRRQHVSAARRRYRKAHFARILY